MNNKLNKVKQFFKKEGFYVILFVCLCAVATVAAVTAGRNNSKNSEEDKVALEQTEKEVVTQPEKPENALQVKDDLESVPTVQNDDTAAVSSQTEVSFKNPVEGTLGRAYSEDPVYWATTKSYKNHLAMDVKAAEGSAVVAVSAGVVKKVDVSTEGTYVEIDHQNGLTTIYGNLRCSCNGACTLGAGQSYRTARACSVRTDRRRGNNLFSCCSCRWAQRKYLPEVSAPADQVTQARCPVAWRSAPLATQKDRSGRCT